MGLKPPLAVLEQREIERGFRVIGQTKGHCELVHKGIDYDLELDTSILNPKKCVETILAALPNIPLRDK